MEVLSAEFACRHKVVPLQLTDDILKVGVCQIDNEQLLSDLEFLTGKPVEAVQLSEEEISQALQDLYGAGSLLTPSPPAEHGEFQVVEKVRENPKDEQIYGRRATPAGLRQESDELSVVALVNQIITEAIDGHASDIHIEAYEQYFRVRYRLDGVLHEVLQPPLDRKAAIISRLKIMADLDIAEKRRPQDGRIRVKRGSRVIDIRVSTLPTDFGEKVVLRILDKSQLNLDLEKLGFDDDALQSFKQAIGSPHGMILVIPLCGAAAKPLHFTQP